MQVFLLIYWLLLLMNQLFPRRKWKTKFFLSHQQQTCFFVSFYFPSRFSFWMVSTKEVQKFQRVKYISTPKRCSIEDIIHFINYISGRSVWDYFSCIALMLLPAIFSRSLSLYSSFLSITSIKIAVGPPYGSLGSLYSLIKNEIWPRRAHVLRLAIIILLRETHRASCHAACRDAETL